MTDIQNVLIPSIDYNLEHRLNTIASYVFTNNTDLASLSGYIDFGTYSPQVSGAVNNDSPITCTTANYNKIGTSVDVFGEFTVDATSGTVTSFEINLPIASNLAQTYDLSGIAIAAGVGNAEIAQILGSVANNRAVVQYVAQDLAAKTFSYKFSYKII